MGEFFLEHSCLGNFPSISSCSEYIVAFATLGYRWFLKHHMVSTKTEDMYLVNFRQEQNSNKNGVLLQEEFSMYVCLSRP